MPGRTIRLPRGLGPGGIFVALLVAAASLLGECRERFGFSPPAAPAGLAAWRVAIVHDGDTVTCRDSLGRETKIRLKGIDAPEFAQPHGRAATAALERAVGGRRVGVEGKARDRFGRLLGTLWLEGDNINRRMVAEGHAWVFDGYAPDGDLLAAERQARRGRRGLWAADDPIPPREWRQAHPRE